MTFIGSKLKAELMCFFPMFHAEHKPNHKSAIKRGYLVDNNKKKIVCVIGIAKSANDSFYDLN